MLKKIVYHLGTGLWISMLFVSIKALYIDSLRIISEKIFLEKVLLIIAIFSKTISKYLYFDFNFFRASLLIGCFFYLIEIIFFYKKESSTQLKISKKKEIYFFLYSLSLAFLSFVLASFLNVNEVVKPKESLFNYLVEFFISIENCLSYLLMVSFSYLPTLTFFFYLTFSRGNRLFFYLKKIIKK